MKPLIVSPSPHLHARDSIEKRMYRVLISLAPAWCCGCLYFGWNAILTTSVAVCSCLLTEYVVQKFLLKNTPTLLDGSCILTAVLLAMNLPADLPWWMVVLGSIFAIGIGKMVFGGLGHNLFNPALAGRVFLLISFPAAMTTWPTPAPMAQMQGTADAVSTATPLTLMKEGQIPDCHLLQLFLGDGISGSMGEVCALALLLGGIYLLITRTITWHIPVSILVTVVVFTGIMHGIQPSTYAPPLFHLLTGGLLLGSFFMATDYVTSPMTGKAQLIYGVGIGIITVLIRLWGNYPEGMSFAILIMNAVTPLLNKYIHPKRFAD